MAVNLSPVGGVAAQFFTNTGAVLTGGKIYTYLAGTTTPATTYTSSNGATPWTNPIVLDAAGRVPSGGEIWLTDGIIYKFVLKDSTDVLIATYDNITGINSNAVAYTNQQQIITATAGQTVFNLSFDYQVATNSLSVFVDGVNQYGPSASYAYVETDSNTVTFNNGLHVGAVVKFTTTQQQGAGAVDASQVTYDPPFTNSVATNVEAKLAQSVNVKDFGALGNGVADDTVAIQRAINYVSNSNVRTLYFPAGTYNFTRLYCYYDASLNPGYNVSRNAKITLQGDGTLPEVSGICGTILSSTVTTGDCLVVSGAAEDASPYRSRDFNMRDITVQGATSGYLMVLAGVITPHLEYVKLVQNNNAGSGLYISTSFFATLEKMQFANNAVGAKTGDAIRFDTTLFAGLFTLRDCNINGFAVGLYKGTGGWQNLSIYDSEIAASNCPIYLGGGTLDVLNIQGCYFEGVCANFIQVFPEFGLNTLNITGSWFYSDGLTGRAIDLRRMGAVNINGCYVLNQYTDFLNIDDSIVGYNGGAFSVNGLEITYTGSNPTSNVYYFIGGVIPALYSIDYPKSVAFCKLTVDSKRPIGSRLQFGTVGSTLFAGHSYSTMLYNAGSVSGATISLIGVTGGIPAFVTGSFMTTASDITLPASSSSPPHGLNITITSSVSSTTTANVKLDASDGGTTLATLSAGQQRTFVFFNDGVTTGWY